MLKLPALIDTSNPIVGAEFRHQRFVIRRGRTGGLWILIAIAMLVPSFLMSIWLTIGAFVLPYRDIVSGVIGLSNGFWVMLMVIMSLAMYMVVTLMTMGLSGNSIGREKRGHTWDHLRMTNLPPQKIIWGKWWASLKALRGDHLMLTLLRFGIVAGWLIASYTWFSTPFDYTVTLIVTLAITIVYGLLEAGLTASLGILASTPAQSGIVISSIVLTARVLSMGFFLYLWLGTILIVPYGLSLIGIVTILGFIFYILAIVLVVWFAQQLVG